MTYRSRRVVPCIYNAVEHKSPNTAREHGRKVVSQNRAVRVADILQPRDIAIHILLTSSLQLQAVISAIPIVSLASTQLSNLVHHVHHVASNVGRAHVAQDLAAIDAALICVLASLANGLLKSEYVRHSITLEPCAASQLQQGGVAAEVVMREAIGARPAVADAARVKRHNFVMATAGLVENVSQAFAAAEQGFNA